LAAEFGVYPRCSTAFSTFIRVPGATTLGRLSTRETVAVDTPACLATAWMFDTRGDDTRKPAAPAFDVAQAGPELVEGPEREARMRASIA
jgi:hypothetical protein